MPKPPQPEASIKSGVLLASPQEAIGECLDRMAEANVGSILIVAEQRPVGIMTERDLLRQWRQVTAAHHRPIGELFTKDVLCLKIGEISKGPALMVERRIRHVPLVDDQGAVVGILSMRDILAAEHQAGKLPKLVLSGKAAQQPSCILHLLTPTAQLDRIALGFLPNRWSLRVWRSVEALQEFLAEPAAQSWQQTAFLLDLDGLADFADWRPLLSRFIRMLGQSDQPTLLFVASPQHFSEPEQRALRQVVAKAHWRFYLRPLAVQTLAHDLAGLDPPKT